MVVVVRERQPPEDPNMITLPNGLVLPTSLISTHHLVLHPIPRERALVRSNVGAPCPYCQTEGRNVEIAAYGTTESGDKILVESCAECAERRLFVEGASISHPVTLEYAT
jgi:hypothetical protein